MRIALTIAGSDSGGGAGLQADIKVFARFSVFGTSVVTAVTAQNTCGVRAVAPVSVDVVEAQIDAVADDLRPDALKTGMLARPETVAAVARGIRRHGLAPLVVDPVMVATSGRRLLADEAVAILVRDLLPVAALVTPNLDEASVLLGEPVTDEAAMVRAATHIVRKLGAAAALVTGGHLAGSSVVDILVDGATTHRFAHPKIATASTHGTGCTLSAAITAQLALGASLADAVTAAIDYVCRAIAAAPGFGRGHGPLDHGA